jgi:glutathione S-transferase
MDYKLYYWDLPFRGVFIEMLLAEAGAKYSRHDASDIYPQRSLKITNPGIAPPYLYPGSVTRIALFRPAGCSLPTQR